MARLQDMNNAIPEIIKFTRKKDYKFIQPLGSGALGYTILVEDETINEQFVCKKYSPIEGVQPEKYYKNFVDEIKLMHKLFHNNIVRIYNYYLFEEYHTGYILMEYIDGLNIEEYLKLYPENINNIFEQIINGFAYLESQNILHRDIRSGNILVDKNGFVKIIDFGFGKKALNTVDFNKSISLAWWCELPLDFQYEVYDFKTELYFIGKLFEKIITENEIENFEYNDILSKMCNINPYIRPQSFEYIERILQDNTVNEDLFSYDELKIYRAFSDNLANIIGSIYSSAKYWNDIEIVQKNLSDLYKKIMLEVTVPKNTFIIQCFLNGSYKYSNRKTFETSKLKNFLNLLKSCSKDKKNIILSNIHSRLDSIERIDEFNDEIPF